MNRAAMKTPVQKMANFATFRLPLVTLPATLLKAVRKTAEQQTVCYPYHLTCLL